MRYLIALFILLLPTASLAQRASHCIAIAQAPGLEYVHRASFRDPLEDFSVRISYLAHSMFLIQSASGPSAVTDYTGFVGSTGFFPDVATMNNAHDSHWTAFPDNRIPDVLPGWPVGGEKANHRIQVGDMLVRNVTTDIRSRSFFDEENTGIRRDGNSIFVFETEGLCIGHVGHLHHEPDDAQYAALGRLDVVMVPVDGGMTIDRASLKSMLVRLRSSLVLPMHWFGPSNLEAFLVDMADDYVIQRTLSNSMEVSLRTLPSEPTILVLTPQYLTEPQ